MKFATLAIALLLFNPFAITAAEIPALGAALKALDESLNNKPDEQQKAFQVAITAIDKVILTSPTNVEAHYHRGRLLFYLQSDAKAEEAYKAAIKIDEDHVASIFMLGVLNVYRKRTNEAASLFRKVIQLAPDHTNARMELANILIDSKREDEALTLLDKIVDIEPEHADANHEIASILSGKGQHQEALPHFKTAVEEAPENLLFSWNLGQCLQIMGRPKEALEIFLTYRHQSPTDWHAYEKIIQTAEKLGRTKLRDEWIIKITQLYNSGQAPKLSKQKFFIRDQFAQGDFYVFALEYFELLGDRAIKYSLRAENSTEPETEIRISLGSYDTTNSIALELGEIPKDKRRYHLDGYKKNAHFTYAFFTSNPGYKLVKTMAREILQGKRGAISSSTYGDGENTITVPGSGK